MEFRKKRVMTYKGQIIISTEDIFIDTYYSRRKWSKIIKILKKGKCKQLLFFYPKILTFTYKGHIQHAVIQDGFFSENTF